MTDGEAQLSRRVCVIGGLGVHPAERLSAMGRRVLAHIAVHGPVEYRGIVSSELWPDVPDERARANLRRALWQLPSGWITVDGPDLVLEAEVDIAEAESLAHRATSGDALTMADVQLLSRDLLPGWYEEWIVTEQDRFRLLRVQALEAACRTAARWGDGAVATQAGLAAVAAEPLRESAVTALVEAHIGEGNRVAAVRRFQAYAELLDMEIGARPGLVLSGLIEDVLKTA